MVYDRCAHTLWWAIRLTRHRHQSALCLRSDVEPRAGGGRAFRPVPAHRDGDDFRSQALEFGRGESQSIEGSRAKIVQQDVARCDQIPSSLQFGGVFEVEAD